MISSNERQHAASSESLFVAHGAVHVCLFQVGESNGNEASLAVIGGYKGHRFRGDPFDGATAVCAQGLPDAEE